MQQAYFSESNTYGGWTLIGYTAPNGGETNNFKYTGAVDAKGTTSAATPLAWAAQNKVKLNDCGNDKVHWQVDLVAVADGKDAYKASVSNDTDGSCLALTATFENIGK